MNGTREVGALRCTHCGTVAYANDNYCARCGTKLALSAACAGPTQEGHPVEIYCTKCGGRKKERRREIPHGAH